MACSHGPLPPVCPNAHGYLPPAESHEALNRTPQHHTESPNPGSNKLLLSQHNTASQTPITRHYLSIHNTYFNKYVALKLILKHTLHLKRL